jgi:hypothetical protein
MAHEPAIESVIDAGSCSFGNMHEDDARPQPERRATLDENCIPEASRELVIQIAERVGRHPSLN